MLPVPSMRDKTAAVLGLGRSGLAVCRALAASNARVWGWDDDSERRADAAAAGATIIELGLCNWDRVDRLVLSPGIAHKFPRPHRLVRQARAAGVSIIGDVELLAENQPTRRIVGITGTNGKSTTTALIGALLSDAGIGMQVGGNIGLPVLDLLPKPSDDTYVLELSSYQLELTEHLACAVAVTLNLTPDHLDRHGGMVGYGQAKKRIFRNQGANDWAVVGVDDAFGQDLVSELATTRQVLPVAVGRALDRGVHVIDGRLYDAIDGPTHPVADLRPIASLRGAHNWQNAAAAYAAVRALGVAPGRAAAGLARFAGLAHRMEQVAVLDGVRYVNDSKATNAEAAARALASFEQVYWIAGGRPKEGGLDALSPWLDRVRHAYLIGEAAEPFAESLAGRVACSRCGDLATAFRQASEAALLDADNDPVVLLTPACASFDQFADFEARGDAFKALVSDMVQQAGASARGGR